MHGTWYAHTYMRKATLSLETGEDTGVEAWRHPRALEIILTDLAMFHERAMVF